MDQPNDPNSNLANSSRSVGNIGEASKRTKNLNIQRFEGARCECGECKSNVGTFYLTRVGWHSYYICFQCLLAFHGEITDLLTHDV